MSRLPRPKRPMVPPERAETPRQLIQSLLLEREMSAKEISFEAHISEKEVYPHLEHLRRSLAHEGMLLEISPAVCRSCGFVFSKRHRLTPPGKCPACRSEQIAEPHFAVAASK